MYWVRLATSSLQSSRRWLCPSQAWLGPLQPPCSPQLQPQHHHPSRAGSQKALTPHALLHLQLLLKTVRVWVQCQLGATALHKGKTPSVSSTSCLWPVSMSSFFQSLWGRKIRAWQLSHHQHYPTPLNTFCTVPEPETTGADRAVSMAGVNGRGAPPPTFMARTLQRLRLVCIWLWQTKMQQIL